MAPMAITDSFNTHFPISIDLKLLAASDSAIHSQMGDFRYLHFAYSFTRPSH
jgi:hypothetical protein